MFPFARNILIVLGLLSLNSCHYLATLQIEGIWMLDEVFENNHVLRDKTLGSIQLKFDDKGRYSYRGTLNYREEGNFLIKRNLLIMHDALSKTEKKLFIDNLSSRKLILLMQESGKIRKMIFYKARD